MKRRNRVSHRESVWVAVVATLGGIIAVTSPARPVTTAGLDQVLVFALAAATVWASATAPWWAPGVAAGALAVADPGPWQVAVGLAVCTAACVTGARRQSWPVVRAVAGAGVVQLALRLHLGGPFGTSALVAAGAIGLLLVTGVLRRHRAERRRVWWVAAGLGVGCGLALVGAGVGAATARGELDRGVDAAREGLAALRRGDAEAAAERLDVAAAALGRAHGALERPWVWPARAVPVLSQHVKAATDVVDAARRAAREVGASVAGVDVDGVRIEAGAVDLDAVSALTEPLTVSLHAVARLDHAVAAARSGWLVGPAATSLADLAHETADAHRQASSALEVTRLAPRLLGADGPRVWLVLFTTPAEARGLGGFPGNYAEIVTDLGTISVTRFGRALDLIGGGADPDGRLIAGPVDYLARYGVFGAGGGGHPASRMFWNNTTLSPDLPSVATVVEQLYRQSGGRPIDGVIVADPYALQGIVELTGPLTVPGRAAALTAADTPAFLLRGQYTAFPGENQERKDALADVAEQAITALLGGALPGPAQIADALGDPIRTGHLMIWSLHPADQGPLRDLGVAGAVPAPAPDGFFVTVNNSGPNKLDAYLDRSTEYEAVVDTDSGAVAATVTLRLRNTLAPDADLPPDISGNERGLPLGTNRMYLSVYSPLQIVQASVDGSPRAFAVSRELGWQVGSAYLNITPGEEAVVKLVLGGALDLRDGYGLTLRSQPLAAPERVVVRVTDRFGRTLAHHDGTLASLVTTLRGGMLSS